jgi:hypothetical protein
VSIQKQRSSLNQGIKFECNQPQNASGFYSVTPVTPVTPATPPLSAERDFLLEPSRALARWALNHSWGKAGREEQAAAEPVDVARQEAAVPWGAVAEKESPVRHWESTG